jgi:transposase
MVCTTKDCGKKFFAEPLAMTHPYGRHTHEVEERIRHEALCQTARKASETLAMQHIQISASACIRVLRLLGRVNPEVRTSGFVGLDDFAKWKGHKYMCVIVDHYTREVLAVFDSRYGQEITDWLKSHPEIRVVTRDGSQSYASVISAGCITPSTVVKRLEGKVPSSIVHRCMRSLSERYKVLREEVRIHNKALGEQKKTISVRESTIWKYIVTGETTSKKLLKLHETHPEVEQVILTCINFRKMLHDEDDAPTMDEWLNEAGACPLKEIRGFAEYIRKDRKAVELACQTSFNNGLLEGTVNKAKAIKRSMFNRAKPEVLRAKMLYSGLKWGWNYHPN